MHLIGIVVLMLCAAPAADSGYITIRSTLPGIPVYLDGDYLGRTPVERRPFRTGSHLLTIVSNDSLENVYAGIRSGPVGGRLSAVWTLTAIDAGTYQVDIRTGTHSEVTIDHGRIIAAPGRAKRCVGGTIGGIFGLGAGLGFLLGWLIFR